jgi:outer membrane assembly lipoprotein YfiO
LCLALLCGCAAAPPQNIPESVIELETDWRFEPGRGYVRGTEAISEADFVNLARKASASSDADQAAAMYDLLVRHSQSAAVMQEAYFGRGEALVKLGMLPAAYSNYQQYLSRFSGSDRDPLAKRQLFEISRSMIVRGTTRHILGVPYSSAEEGILRMKRTLETYPREDFSTQYGLWLADYLYDQERIEEAQVEYQFIEQQYGRDEPAVAVALFRIGECELSRYQGTRLDVRALTEADKYYARVLDEFPKSEIARSAAERRAYVQEQLATKEFNNGDFYRSKGYPRAAALYYRKIISQYPRTSVAVRARERLEDLGLPANETP